MKFLAMLKDSLREAIDTKVFYVMVGLSVLITLLAFTLSFKPRSGEEFFSNPMTNLMLSGVLTVDDPEDLGLDQLMARAQMPGFRAYRVLGAQPANGAPAGLDSPYQVTLGVFSPRTADAEQLREDPSPVVTRIKERFGKIDKLSILTVTDVRVAPSGDQFIPKTPYPNELFFQADVTPTPEARRLWPHDPSLFFGAFPLDFGGLGNAPLGLQLYIIEDLIINGIGAWVAILISIIITAFFIPNMLRKGTVDLLLVKPVHRTTLLLYKYVGGLTFIFLNTTIAVVGVWVALGLRSGIWAPSFLLTIFIITAFFAILYGVSTLFGVLTRSPIVAILLTAGVWFVLFIIGQLFAYGEVLRQQEERKQIEARKGQTDPDLAQIDAPGDPTTDKDGDKEKRRRQREAPELPGNSNNWFFKSVRAVHFVLPRTKDLDMLTSQLLMRDLLTGNQLRARRADDMHISWGESLTVSGVFLALMLGLSCLRFATRDY